MKEVHLLKFKWLYSMHERLEPKDSFFIYTTLHVLRHNAYGLNKKQLEKLDCVYEKYRTFKVERNILSDARLAIV